MKQIIIRILKSVGLYNVLLKQKRNWNQRQFEKLEARNATKRSPFYSQFISKGDLVFDVGANIGNRVEVFLALGSKVVAVEPQQDCVAELKRKFGSRISIIEKGLGEKEEQKTLYISDTNTISSLSKEWIDSVKDSRFSRHEWNKTAQIELTTLDKLISQFGVPQFCKIDVEGFELEVLKGLHQTVPCLSLEYTVPEQTDKLLACLAYCNSLNKHYQYNYSSGEEMKLDLEKFCTYQEFLNIVKGTTFQATGFGDIYVRS